MSQMDKFYARTAKTAKMKKDEEVIKTAEAKQATKTIEQVGAEVAKKKGMSTEDIFMIIARDSVGTWMKMWNNSMESVIRETIQSELPDMIKQVMQEELASAARGFMKGLMPIPTQEMITDEILANFNPKSDVFKNGLQQLAESREAEIAEIELSPIESKLNEIETHEEKFISIEAEKSEVYFQTTERGRLAIIEYYEKGNDPTIIKDFKKISPHHNTIYQHFAKQNPGRGNWKRYVESIIFEHDNAEFKIEGEKHD